MIALVFSYEVADGAEFERVYANAGDWAEFFRRGRGFIGTELLRDLEHPGRYLVIDRWVSAEAYDAFVKANRDEYMRRVPWKLLPGVLCWLVVGGWPVGAR